MKIFIYHNDDPFRKTLHRRLKSFHYLRCVKYADITYVYRPVNIEEAKQWGAKEAKLYMSHYYSKTDLKEYTQDQLSKKNGQVVFTYSSPLIILCNFSIGQLFAIKISFQLSGPYMWKFIPLLNNSLK